MSFPRYPAYKDSGVEWLRGIPEHWKIQKFRHLFRESNEKIAEEVIGPMLSVSGYRGVEVKEYDDENRRRTDEDLVGYRIVRRGQLVVNTMWLNYAGLGISSHEGHVSPAYRAYSLDNALDKRYVHHLLRSGTYVQGYTSLLTGIRPNSLQMSRDHLMSFPVVTPPRADQEFISAFLDHETAKIDALIAEQQRLIELLQEKRQAVISHAVTKGLNPGAPMKDSGVEWLGAVPEHWVVCPVKFHARIGNGSTPNRDNSDYWTDAGFPWLNSSVVNQAEVSEAERFVTQLALKECHLPIIEPPAVLVGITGQGKTRGMAAPLRFVATLNQHVAYIKPNAERLGVDYLQRALEAAYDHLRTESEGVGSTKGAITCEQLGAWKMPIPHLREQEAIVSFLKEEVARLDTFNGESERAIALLQERRSALISAVVTGLIDVRSLVKEGSHK